MGGPGKNKKVERAIRQRTTERVVEFLSDRALIGFELADLYGASSRPFSSRMEANEWWMYAISNGTIVQPTPGKKYVASSETIARQPVRTTFQQLHLVRQPTAVIDVQKPQTIDSKNQVPNDLVLLVLYLGLKLGSVFEIADVRRYYSMKLAGIPRFPWTNDDYTIGRLQKLTNSGYLEADSGHTIWILKYFDEAWGENCDVLQLVASVPVPKPKIVPEPEIPQLQEPTVLMDVVVAQPLLAAVAIQPELPQMPKPSYVMIDFKIGPDNRISNADRVLWLKQQFRDRSFGSSDVNELAGKPGVPFLDKCGFSNLVARSPSEFSSAFGQVLGVSPRQWMARPMREAAPQQVRPIVAAPVVVIAPPVVDSPIVTETVVCDLKVIAENAVLKRLLAERLATLAAAEREAAERTTQILQEQARAAQLDALVNPMMNTIVWGKRLVRLLDKLSGSGKAL